MKLKCYYAHPMSLYGTKQEERDIALLESLGFEVENPNTHAHQEGMWRYGGRPGDPRSMEYFRGIAMHCDVVAFRAMPDGSITAGVADEIRVAKLVFELPSGIKRRTLTIEQTSETLRECGQR
jgi:hypothetical protein